MEKLIKQRSQYSGKTIKCNNCVALAKSLLRTHGMKRALEISQSQHWYGIIKILDTQVLNTDQNSPK